MEDFNLLAIVFRAGRNGLKCLRLVGMIRLHVYSLLYDRYVAFPLRIRNQPLLF
jgi:hypothetical protein